MVWGSTPLSIAIYSYSITAIRLTLTQKFGVRIPVRVPKNLIYPCSRIGICAALRTQVFCGFNSHHGYQYAPVAQQEVQHSSKVWVVGSSPTWSAIYLADCNRQTDLTQNQGFVGSSPTPGTKNFDFFRNFLYNIYRKNEMGP